MEFQLAPFALPAGYGEGIVSTSSVKAHIGLLHCDDDALLEVYRDAGIDLVERYCGVRLAPCEGLTWQGESLPRSLDLSVWPVTAITAISYLDSTGEEQTAVASDWRVVRRGEIALKPGRDMPEDVAAAVSITFDAGFAAGECPEQLKQAVRVFAAHLYRNREGYEVGSMSGGLPAGFTHPLKAAGYRLPVI